MLPLLPLESGPVLPGLVAHMQIPKGRAVRAVERAEKQMVGLLLPKRQLRALPPPPDSEDAAEIVYAAEDLHQRGVSAKILKKILLPDGTMSLLVHGVSRFEVGMLVQSEPFLTAQVSYFEDLNARDPEVEALARQVLMQVKQLSENNPFFTDELKLALINAPSHGALADMVAFSLNLRGPDAQGYIETVDVKERLLKILVFLKKEQDVSKLQKKLADEVESRVAKFQREYFLKEQLKTIKRELGMEEDDKSREKRTLEERLAKANLPEHARKVADEELHRLSTIPETSPEFNLTRNYLDWIAALPWSKQSTDNLDLKNARRVLDRHHFGIEKVKERILEFLAVRKLKPGYEGSILLLVGPPGVGKTSLGKSVAESLGREFFRFSLGGMRDEAEIKGHRRTYVGAMPGKILQGLKRVGTNNPVILLDEVDKLGASYQGDPASALLEVLDPEQNHGFLDHYLDIQFDLSKVLFIATANTLQTIPPALMDRMEVIELPGYTEEDKVEIARRYLLPRQRKANGIEGHAVEIPDETLRVLIRSYTREAGVRNLEREIANLARKAIKEILTSKGRTKVHVTRRTLEKYAGVPRFRFGEVETQDLVGVTTGLAWTEVGGELL
ncbi:MAG: endopeptidase La, partial [Bdellovibrionales bacterium]|nr:endopeptidase La [Bdellovibrionales bacterium]